MFSLVISLLDITGHHGLQVRSWRHNPSAAMAEGLLEWTHIYNLVLSPPLRQKKDQMLLGVLTTVTALTKVE